MRAKSDKNVFFLSENVKCADRLGDVGVDGRSEFIWTLKVTGCGGFSSI